MFFYLMFLKIYDWEKLTFSKLVGKVRFSERKFKEMHLLWRAKRYKIYSGKRLFWHYCLQLFFVHKSVSQMSFNLFCLGDKSLLSEFLRKWGLFQGHNKRFLKYLAQALEKCLDILGTNQFTKSSTNPTKKTRQNLTSFIEN